MNGMVMGVNVLVGVVLNGVGKRDGDEDGWNGVDWYICAARVKTNIKNTLLLW